MPDRNAADRHAADALRLLVDGAARLGVPLEPEPARAMLRLLDELERWNAAYNLTAIRDRRQMLTHHLLDSLSVHRALHGTRIADVGTGAGFPGLPLAIADPQRHFTLLDSNGKKIRFVTHAARVLGLKNVDAVHARAERFTPAAPFDTVVARAFAALETLAESIAPLCGPDTRVLAMKGRPSEGELAALPPGWSIERLEALDVPGLGEERQLVVLRAPGAPAPPAGRPVG
jgi:16S rRNA (guanine527-N7)-methyltransferase